MNAKMLPAMALVSVLSASFAVSVSAAGKTIEKDSEQPIEKAPEPKPEMKGKSKMKLKAKKIMQNSPAEKSGTDYKPAKKSADDKKSLKKEAAAVLGKDQGLRLVKK